MVASNEAERLKELAPSKDGASIATPCTYAGAHTQIHTRTHAGTSLLFSKSSLEVEDEKPTPTLAATIESPPPAEPPQPVTQMQCAVLRCNAVRCVATWCCVATWGTALQLQHR